MFFAPRNSAATLRTTPWRSATIRLPSPVTTSHPPFPVMATALRSPVISIFRSDVTTPGRAVCVAAVSATTMIPEEVMKMPTSEPMSSIVTARPPSDRDRPRARPRGDGRVGAVGPANQDRRHARADHACPRLRRIGLGRQSAEDDSRCWRPYEDVHALDSPVRGSLDSVPASRYEFAEWRDAGVPAELEGDEVIFLTGCAGSSGRPASGSR